jgi:hypothetical protein
MTDIHEAIKDIQDRARRMSAVYIYKRDVWRKQNPKEKEGEK